MSLKKKRGRPVGWRKSNQSLQVVEIKKGPQTKFNESMLPIIISLMKEGFSKAEVCHELSINRDTLLEWEKTYPEVSGAIKIGTAFSEGWWMKQGRNNIGNIKFNTALWFINMKNRFGWRDKQDVEHSGAIAFKPNRAFKED